MNRSDLQRLAEGRVVDAKALLDAGRWSGAYYLAGYALECGLKACVLGFVDRTGVIFRDKDYSRRCFTHNLGELIAVADLKDDHENRLENNAAFAGFWKIAGAWTEAARYQEKSESEARSLYEAVTNDPDGILSWIRANW